MFTATPAKWYRENRRDRTESGGCCGPIWSDESLRRHVLAVRSENSSGTIRYFFVCDIFNLIVSQIEFNLRQVLVTKSDFYNEETRRHLASTVSELISLNIVPIINTNDAVSPPPLVDEDLAGVKYALSLLIKFYFYY